MNARISVVSRAFAALMRAAKLTYYIPSRGTRPKMEDLKEVKVAPNDKLKKLVDEFSKIRMEASEMEKDPAIREVQDQLTKLRKDVSDKYTKSNALMPKITALLEDVPAGYMDVEGRLITITEVKFVQAASADAVLSAMSKKYPKMKKLIESVRQELEEAATVVKKEYTVIEKEYRQNVEKNEKDENDKGEAPAKSKKTRTPQPERSMRTSLEPSFSRRADAEAELDSHLESALEALDELSGEVADSAALVDQLEADSMSEEEFMSTYGEGSKSENENAENAETQAPETAEVPGAPAAPAAPAAPEALELAPASHRNPWFREATEETPAAEAYVSERIKYYRDNHPDMTQDQAEAAAYKDAKEKGYDVTIPKRANKMTPEAEKWISDKIKKLRDEGKSADQAEAEAYSMAREKGYDVPADPDKKSALASKETPAAEEYVSKRIKYYRDNHPDMTQDQAEAAAYEDAKKEGFDVSVPKHAAMDVVSHIVKRKDGYYVVNKDRTKTLGGPYSHAEAVKRLRQIEYFKHHKGSLTAHADAKHFPSEFDMGSGKFELVESDGKKRLLIMKDLKSKIQKRMHEHMAGKYQAGEAVAVDLGDRIVAATIRSYAGQGVYELESEGRILKAPDSSVFKADGGLWR